MNLKWLTEATSEQNEKVLDLLLIFLISVAIFLIGFGVGVGVYVVFKHL